MNEIFFVATVALVLAFAAFRGVKLWIKMRLHRRMKSLDFKRLYEESIRDIVEVCEELKVVYWFTEGTLIGLLRYGANHHESRELSVDDDIDVMIEVANHEDWIRVKEQIRHVLEQKGWTNVYERTTSSSKKGRVDKIQLWMYKFGSFTHVDFHSYFVDPQKEVAFSHKEPNSYPFQYWQGNLPVEFIHPFKRASCYGLVVPCPNKAVELLKGWNGGEYLDSCLAFPPGKTSAEERKIISDCSDDLEKNGFASMKEEIITCNSDL